jgi:hypothetical protein
MTVQKVSAGPDWQQIIPVSGSGFAANRPLHPGVVGTIFHLYVIAGKPVEHSIELWLSVYARDQEVSEMYINITPQAMTVNDPQILSHLGIER